MIKKDKNMTIDNLRKLPRISRNGETSILGVFIDADERGDTELADLCMTIMGEQNAESNLGTRDDRGIPMCGGTPGHSRELLRRIDLREKG